MCLMSPQGSKNIKNCNKPGDWFTTEALYYDIIALLFPRASYLHYLWLVQIYSSCYAKVCLTNQKKFLVGGQR